MTPIMVDTVNKERKKLRRADLIDFSISLFSSSIVCAKKTDEF